MREDIAGVGSESRRPTWEELEGWVFSDGSGPNSVWFHRWEQAYG